MSLQRAAVIAGAGGSLEQPRVKQLPASMACRLTVQAHRTKRPSELRATLESTMHSTRLQEQVTLG